MYEIPGYEDVDTEVREQTTKTTMGAKTKKKEEME